MGFMSDGIHEFMLPVRVLSHDNVKSLLNDIQGVPGGMDKISGECSLC